MKKEMKMKKARVILKVIELTDWVNAMLIVHKPNVKLHICFDPHYFNKHLQLLSYVSTY